MNWNLVLSLSVTTIYYLQLWNLENYKYSYLINLSKMQTAIINQNKCFYAYEYVIKMRSTNMFSIISARTEQQLESARNTCWLDANISAYKCNSAQTHSSGRFLYRRKYIFMFSKYYSNVITTCHHRRAMGGVVDRWLAIERRTYTRFGVHIMLIILPHPPPPTYSNTITF